MGAWRSAPRNWKPRLPVGSARPKRRTPKRTSFTAATRPARSCRPGSPTSSGVRGRTGRAKKIRQAKAELEAEAKAAAEAERKEWAAAEAKREAEGRRQGGRKAAPPSPPPGAQGPKNVTHPPGRR